VCDGRLCLCRRAKSWFVTQVLNLDQLRRGRDGVLDDAACRFGTSDSTLGCHPSYSLKRSFQTKSGGLTGAKAHMSRIAAAQPSSTIYVPALERRGTRSSLVCSRDFVDGVDDEDFDRDLLRLEEKTCCLS